jgi:hypothetical protein
MEILNTIDLDDDNDGISMVEGYTCAALNRTKCNFSYPCFRSQAQYSTNWFNGYEFPDFRKLLFGRYL